MLVTDGSLIGRDLLSDSFDGYNGGTCELSSLKLIDFLTEW